MMIDARCTMKLLANIGSVEAVQEGVTEHVGNPRARAQH